MFFRIRDLTQADGMRAKMSGPWKLFPFAVESAENVRCKVVRAADGAGSLSRSYLAVHKIS